MRGIAIAAAVALLALLAGPAGIARADSAAELDCSALKLVPVVADGRAEPLDTYARQFARVIAGEESCGGRDYMQIFALFLFDPLKAQEEPLVLVESAALRKAIGFPADRTHFSALEIVQNDRIAMLFQSQPRTYEAAALQGEAWALTALVSSVLQRVDGLLIVPPLPGLDKWQTLSEINDSKDPRHVAVMDGYRAMAEAWKNHDATAFKEAAARFKAALRAVNPAAEPPANKMLLEATYNDARLFEKAWLTYLVGLAMAAALFFLARRRLTWIPLIMVFIGAMLHTAGLCARTFIAGRAPVGDMYESMVFAAWVVVIIGMFATALRREVYFTWCGAALSGALLLGAGFLPGGTTVSALSPVLMNDFWLSAHVAVVLAGFAALGLASAAGHYGWWIYICRPSSEWRLKPISDGIYRVMQAGVVLLAAGTIMGALWADQAWGRLWGWDSKEVWALAVILLYMIILHARKGAFLREFGLVIGSIWGFVAALMAWYGVNYILRTGRHSYGQGQGGETAAVIVLGAETLITLSAMLLRSARIAAALRAQAEAQKAAESARKKAEESNEENQDN